MTARALIAYARSRGWRFARRGGKGSHLVFKHPRKSYDVTIPDHGSKDLPRGLAATVVKQIEGKWSKRL
jgi:predicted RNA binding protein YcfA (HicA-like mRNA interferase family)